MKDSATIDGGEEMKMLMMPTPEGVESSGGHSGSVFPLRSLPAAACWLFVYMFFYIRHHSLEETLEMEKYHAKGTLEMGKSTCDTPGGGRACHQASFPSCWPLGVPLQPILFVSKIPKRGPLTLLFFESCSLCKVKNTKRAVFYQTELESEERGLFRKSLKHHKTWE
jgi:hypothetical protein